MSSAISYSAPHISGKVWPGQPRDDVHKLPDVNILKAQGLGKGAIAKAMGTTGTKKVAVILVNFTGVGSASASGGYDIGSSPGYSTINTYLDNLTKFYTENSYGQLTLSISVFPSNSSAYTLPHTISYYGNNGPGDSLIEQNSYNLISDAINAASAAGVSKTNYDAVVVLHAGYGEESDTKNTFDIYSLFLDWKNEPGYFAVNGFTESLIVPALALDASPQGVICHEFGHQLGLPDLYSTDDDPNLPQTRVGKWCIMDAGTWAGSPAGSQPSHLSAWCKKHIGWISTTKVTGKKTGVDFYAAETDKTGIYEITIEVGSGAEYFLLEYRWTANPNAWFDKGLPGSGMLIWHIDDTIGSVNIDYSTNQGNDINVDANHPRIALETADHTPPWVGGGGYGNQGEYTDPYREGQFTDPDSRAYNLTVTSITVCNFSGVGTSKMVADIFRAQVAAQISIVKLYNYPNPSTSGRTAITFTLDRPTSVLSVDMYNLAGEFVCSIPYDKMLLTQADDLKYGYTINWDGKNSSGMDVSNGIYIYLLRAGQEIKTGKLAILRQ